MYLYVTYSIYTISIHMHTHSKYIYIGGLKVGKLCDHTCVSEVNLASMEAELKVEK